LLPKIPFHHDMLHVSILRSLYLSIRFGGQIIVLRGTRIRIDRRARIQVAPGCRLVIGREYPAGSGSSLDLRRDALLSVNGSGMVSIVRGARVQVLNRARLEIGGKSIINHNVNITCGLHIRIGSGVGIAWNANIFDGNFHRISIGGVPRPPVKPLHIGDHAWIGSGAIIMGATIGPGALVGAGSVVVSDVPAEVVVAGNPARVIAKDVSFQFRD
jgi:acetyltransferase-like isoleucine patch superfamily enzyme